MARPKAESFSRSFQKDLKYWLGEEHWPTVTSWRQVTSDQWKSKTVRNYTFATIDHKAAVLLDATPSLHVEPLDDAVSYDQRQQISACVKHELERLRWDDVTEDTLLNGAITGLGVVMCRTEQDKLSLQHKIALDIVDPGRFYPDPSASRLSECRYVCYEPELDMSRIKQYFPDKGHLVKSGASTITGQLPVSETRARTDDEIINAPGQEILYGKDGAITQRKANVAFVWIKDDSLTEDIQTRVLKDAIQIQDCPECGLKLDGGPEPDTECPVWGSEALSTIDLPAETEQNTVISRSFPFGRLIVYSGEVLLYDGPNPYEFPTVFPFAVYVHYRIPGRFQGYGDVALLKSSQMVADKNMAQLIDAMRLTANGPFEYPAEAEAYTNLGNAPGQLVPVGLPFIGKARYVTPQGYNIQLHETCDQANIRDFQRVSGVSDVSIGTSPSAPTSGVEVQARQRAAATRIGKHLKALNQFRGDLASLVWQIMNQYYVGPRTFMAQMPTSEFEAILVDCSTLPKYVAVRVDANVDAIEKDKLMGQNMMMLMTQPNPATGQPIVPPMLDLLLPAIGIDTVLAREIQDRVNQYNMQQALLLQLQPPVPPNAATPNGAPPAPRNGSGESTGGSNTDRALASSTQGGGRIPFQRGQ